jgi:hypothetical protein
MAIPRPALAFAAALLLALVLGVQRADAATILGSADPSVAPDAFACAVWQCPPGASVGFRQFALQGSDTVAEEPGVLVSVRVNARRLGGAAQPRIAVLRPAGDGIGVTVGDFAPVPVVSRDAAVHVAQDLHLRVERGDSIGFLVPAGEVDLGVKMRPRPDGAVQWLTEPCGPCQMDGGTGTELLFDATVEPDDDQDGLGDESQDPDLGLADELFEDDEFDDWDDELDEFEDESDEGSPRRRRKLRLLGIDKAPNGDPILQVRAPGRGVVSATVTTSGGRWHRGIPKTIGLGERRAASAGRERVRLRLSRAGRRMLARPGRQRAVVVVSHRTSRGFAVAMRRFRQ